MRSVTDQYVLRALALTAILAVTVCHADNHLTLSGGRLEYAGNAVFGSPSPRPSRTTAEAQCRQRGGILPADYGSNIANNIATGILGLIGSDSICEANGAGWTTGCYGAYTAGTASYGTCTTNLRRTVSDTNWDTGCNYRWTQGWFGRYLDNGYPGLEFWKSTWAHLNQQSSWVITSANNMRQYALTVDAPAVSNVYQSGPLNGYSTGVRWNASHQCYGVAPACGPQAIAPHGNLHIALGARNIGGAAKLVGMRVDVPDVATGDDIPFRQNNYLLMCQWQGVVNGYYDTTPAPSQYPFVQGWKDLTWAQSHWWVIFIIVAAVILIILFTILIYCCCTRKPLPEGDHLTAMSMREREGSLYVVMDEEVDEHKGTVTSRSALVNPRFVSGYSGQASTNPLAR